MGIGVSGWPLAKAVASYGQLGVVSGSALDTVMSRRLQCGDPDGSIRRALSFFPWPEMARRALEANFIPGGKPEGRPFALPPMPGLELDRSTTELLILANFVEVFLAKEGHNGRVGINYLEKGQLFILPSLLGAMLAGVDVVLMGAGIPVSIPGILDSLACWKPVSLKLRVEGASSNLDHRASLDPKLLASGPYPELSRPDFLAVVSTDVLAKSLLRKANGSVEGFVVENHTAGGHNAPPRKKHGSTDSPVGSYGQKDLPDSGKLRELNRPFWLAGGYGSSSGLQRAQEAGAQGVQVGTIFAFCAESGILSWIKKEVIGSYLQGTLKVLTDFQASPTGFPFKLISLASAGEEERIEEPRKRLCDLGHLRTLYCRKPSGVGFRCPSEPVAAFRAKQGKQSDTEGKRCLCNGLLATIGLGQPGGSGLESPLVTAGEDFSFLGQILEQGQLYYTARDVLHALLGRSRTKGRLQEAPCLCG